MRFVGSAVRLPVAALGWLALLTTGGAGPAPPVAAELSPETFARWRDYVRPSDDERSWQEIPWRTSFWRGVLDAQRERKPVLLWAMNGHPLGCT